MSRNAKAWKFKCALLQYQEPCPAKTLWNVKFLLGILSDETKTSEGRVIFNFGICLRHMKTKNSHTACQILSCRQVLKVKITLNLLFLSEKSSKKKQRKAANAYIKKYQTKNRPKIRRISECKIIKKINRRLKTRGIYVCIKKNKKHNQKSAC